MLFFVVLSRHNFWFELLENFTFQLAWGLTMLYTGGVTDMMEFISLFSTIMGIAVVSSLLYLRITKPKLPRPYQVIYHVAFYTQHVCTNNICFSFLNFENRLQVVWYGIKMIYFETECILFPL